MDPIRLQGVEEGVGVGIVAARRALAHTEDAQAISNVRTRVLAQSRTVMAARVRKGEILDRRAEALEQWHSGPGSLQSEA